MILLDADVLLDVALDRSPHVQASAELLRRLERGPGSAFVAWHTLSNLYYLVRPVSGKDDARAFLGDLVDFVVVSPTDTDDFRYAVELPLGDFEDAMQVAAARACGATSIVTRNVPDFRGSPIPAVTPDEALEALL